jgi:hypothetical protein
MARKPLKRRRCPIAVIGRDPRILAQLALGSSARTTISIAMVSAFLPPPQRVNR